MEHKVLNTMAICRLVNGYERDGNICHIGQTFGANNFSKENHRWCNNEENHCCKTDYTKVYATLKRMKNVESTKLRFFDGGGIGTDIFRFWYLNKKDFEQMILSQTLIPYIEFA